MPFIEAVDDVVEDDVDDDKDDDDNEVVVDNDVELELDANGLNGGRGVKMEWIGGDIVEIGDLWVCGYEGDGEEELDGIELGEEREWGECVSSPIMELFRSWEDDVECVDVVVVDGFIRRLSPVDVGESIVF